MEHQRVDDLEWQGVLLLQQHPDEDVCRTASFGGHGALLRGDVTEAEESGGRVQHRDGDAHEDRGYNVGFSEGAESAAHQGEEKALEEGGGFVESLLQGFVQVDVEFLGLMNVVAHSLEDD